MKIKVTPHSIEIDKPEIINSGEYDVTKCEFEFSEEYEGITKQAVFSTCENTYKVPILNDECRIPSEVLEQRGSVLLGVYGYITIEGSLATRYSPTPQYFSVKEGSYREGNDPELPEPSEWEQVLELINQAITETNNLNITASKEDGITTVTITHKDGTEQTVQIEDGKSLEFNWDGTSLGIRQEGQTEYQYVNLQGPKGEPGAIKFEIVETLPTTDIKEDTIYLLPYPTQTVQELPTTGTPYTIYIVESTGKRYVYESNQWVEITENNRYIEYLYVNGSWEIMGGIGVQIDLTNYVQFTDYPTNDGTKSGVIKVSSNDGISVNTSNNRLQATVTDYGTYQSASNSYIIGKGTLENVITGKALETSNNKVTSISSASTDTQYPSAKCVYDIVGNLETILETLDIGSGAVEVL